MSQHGAIALLGLCEDGVWVEVSHLHLAVAIVGRCTVNAVAIGIGLETAIALVDVRREFLMLSAIDMTIGELLSEEDVIIRPDRHIVCRGHSIVALTARDSPHVDIGTLRHGATSIAVITVVEAVLHIAEVWQRLTSSDFHVGLIDGIIIGIVARGHVVGQRTIGIGLQVLIGCTGLQVRTLIVALVQVEAIQVVGHLTIVEGLIRHLSGHTVRVARRHSVCVALRIVAVLYLYETSLVACRSGRVTEDGTGRVEACGSRALHPAVLDITVTRLSDTCASERTGDTEVIDLTTEVSEQRAGETTEGMTIAMERSLEALAIGARRIVVADRCPCGVLLRTEVAVEDELQVTACMDVVVEGIMILRLTRCSLLRLQAQVEEVLQQVELALVRIRLTFAVVKIDLGRTVDIRIVDIHVMLLILHDGIEVVVVGHTQRHGVRIGLA